MLLRKENGIFLAQQDLEKSLECYRLEQALKLQRPTKRHQIVKRPASIKGGRLNALMPRVILERYDIETRVMS